MIILVLGKIFYKNAKSYENGWKYQNIGIDWLINLLRIKVHEWKERNIFLSQNSTFLDDFNPFCSKIP